MALFLQDILFTGENEKTDLDGKIESIREEITRLKKDVSSIIKEKHVEISNAKSDESLIEKTENLIEQMQLLQDCVDEQVKTKLLSSLKELQRLSSELKEYSYSLNISGQLLNIYSCFKFFKNFNGSTNKQYAAAATILSGLGASLALEDSTIQHLEIYDTLKKEYLKLNEIFVTDLCESWNKKVSWDEHGMPKDDLSKPKCLIIECEYEEIEDIVQGLKIINKLSKHLEILSTKLLKYFILPIIKFECQVKITDEKVFSLEVISKKPTFSLSCSTILYSLQLLFDFLFQNFNILVDENEYFIQKLSSFMFEEFSKVLINECITKTIPTTTAEFENFNATVQEIEEFQNFLIKIKFINDNQKFLSKFTTDINKLYIDKKCENLLCKARDIMKSDLHDYVKHISDVTEECTLKSDEKFYINRKLNKNLFGFPNCQISKSVKDIISLVQEILEEAKYSSDDFALRLFYTTRNIFEMYAALVPEVHKSFLETIPHEVALFHNNCMYLSHILLTLITKYKYNPSSPLQKYAVTYVDQIVLLRQTGSQYFLNHMKYQRNIIYDILRESGLVTIGQSQELPPSIERAIRQCIRQLELLKTVWIEILPINVYYRSLGCIINDMIDDLIYKIIAVEDISAKVATELVTLFNMIVKRIPQIFPEPILIPKYVRKWTKLNELITLLGASLKEIEERWADGKGPLANEFSSHHVKQLIRALFQNTERRSKLLAKIKEK